MYQVNRFNAGQCAIAVVIALSLVSCGESQIDTDPLTFTGDRKPGSFSLLSVESEVFSGKGHPTNFELLADSHFDAFNAGTAAQGANANRGWQQMSGDPNSTQAVDDQDLGGVALMLPPDPAGIELRQATADLGPLDENMWFVATMRAKANAPYTLGLVISYKDGDQRIEAAEGHPGDGQWHDVMLEMPIPANMTKNEYDCSIVHLGNATTAATIQSTSLHLETRDANVARSNLAVNGDFERFGFTQPPYPWRLDRWNSKGLPIVSGDSVLVSADGSGDGNASMSFTPPGESTNVRISQTILSITAKNAGTKLVATAVGLASHNQELWFQLRCQKNGRDVPDQRVFVIHPGDGQWHDLSIKLTVPAQSIADTVYIDAFRRAFTDQPTVIDTIRVERI